MSPISDLAFGPSGDLYLAQQDPAKPSILTIKNGELKHFSGGPKRRQRGNCTVWPSCPDSKVLSDSISFGSVSALTVSPDGSIHVADNEALQIVTLSTVLPQEDKDSGEVKIPDVVAREVYTFNRYGQHTATHGLETGAMVYSFGYTRNTVNGRLAVVSDALGNKVSLQRDYTNRVKSLENTAGQKFNLKLSRTGYLQEFQLDEGGDSKLAFSYGEETGLLESKGYPNGDFYSYTYDDVGRVKSLVTPTGEVFKMESSITLSRSFV